MDDRQRATLRALVDTFVPAIERDDDPTGFWATPGTALFADVGVELYLATLPDELSAGLLQLLDGLGQFGFAHQSQTLREITLRSMRATGPAASMGLDAFRQLSTLIAYSAVDESGSNPLWAGMGYPGPPSPTPPDVDKTLPVTTVDGPTELTAGAVIVGSGSGGAVIAAELAAAGLEVVVVEAGGYFNEGDFNQQEMWAWQNLYYRGGPNPTADGNVTLLAGRALGGGTTVNWSNSVPPRDDVRKRWDDEHGLDGVAGPDFDAHVDAVLSRIGATEACSDHNGPHQRMIEGAERLGWKVRRARLNLDPDRYDPEMAGHTGYGDQTGAKLGAYRTWLQDASDHGARILVGTAVDRVLVEDGRAVGVAGVATDAFGVRHEVRVHAPVVVAACGALETPALLLRSGIGGPAVGHNLHLHPTGAISGTYTEDQRAWWGPVQSAILHEFDAVEDGHGFIIEGTHFNPGLTGSAVPWNSGADHKELLSQTPRSATLIHLTQDRGGGRVVIDAEGQAVHLYPFDDELDVRNFHRGLQATARIHEAAGAEQIACLLPGHEPWRRGDDLESWLAGLRDVPVGAGGLAAFSAHQMGTARMGADPASSVADPRGQLHDTPGVWIGDTSAFPTSSGVNPMVTCMALARRTAHAIVATAR
jgi:choline dehydrogenase-like flavoprotein